MQIEIAMVSDGVNDESTMTSSTVGIAMSAAGSDEHWRQRTLH